MGRKKKKARSVEEPEDNLCYTSREAMNLCPIAKAQNCTTAQYGHCMEADDFKTCDIYKGRLNDFLADLKHGRG